MSCAASSVTLGGITWDIDPEQYSMLGGTRRGSVHKIVDGDTAFQDRGFTVKDSVITLSGQLTSAVTVKAIWALFTAASGTTYTFTDYKGNIFTVLFMPGQESFTVKPIRGSNLAFEYSMTLAVVSVSQWFNGSSPF